MATVKRPAEAEGRRAPRPWGLSNLRGRHWSAVELAVVIAVLAMVMGSLFVTTYSLALGDPVPHRIDAALVGDPAAQAGTVDGIQQVADGSLASAGTHRSPPRCTRLTSRTSTPPSI